MHPTNTTTPSMYEECTYAGLTPLIFFVILSYYKSSTRLHRKVKLYDVWYLYPPPHFVMGLKKRKLQKPRPPRINCGDSVLKVSGPTEASLILNLDYGLIIINH